MSRSVLCRLAPLLTEHDLLEPEHPRTDRYQAGAIVPLLQHDLPVLVDHDDDRVIGRVLELYDADDAAGGTWRWARCELSSPPAWLRMNGGVSFGYASLQRQNMGTWNRVLRAPIRELSLLSPGKEPAEPRARIAWLGPQQGMSGAGTEILYGGPPIHRIGQVLGVR